MMADRTQSAPPYPDAIPAGRVQATTVTPGVSDRSFLQLIYAGAFIIRALIGGMIYFTDNLYYFAGDALVYDSYGWQLSRIWAGRAQYSKWVLAALQGEGTNGMYYWMATWYTIFGRQPFLVMLVQIAVVSFVPILVFKICHMLYGSSRASRYAALMAAYLPSSVIWTCLLLKDPLVLFLICSIIFWTMKMQRELRIHYILPAAGSLLLVYPLRGYVFYFALVAVFGSQLFSRYGRRAGAAGYLVQLGGIAILGAGLLIFGFDRIAREQVDSKLLERVQRSRADLARSAASGFDSKADVSTLGGAVRYLPRGFAYLMFSPFPWQAGGTRVMLAIPEMLLWYCLVPYCVIGIVYTIRHHFRATVIAFVFLLQITLFYSIFQGNVGTAHRQRTQIFIFYFMFTAAGLVLRQRRRRGLLGPITD